MASVSGSVPAETSISIETDVIDPARAALVNKNNNLDLAFGFGRAIIADPSILDNIPNGVKLVLLPDDDPELVRANTAIGLKAVRAGRDVYFRHVRPADFPAKQELPPDALAWLARSSEELNPAESESGQ